MKTIIFTLTLLFSISVLRAQEEITLKKGVPVIKLKKGTYYKTSNNLLEKFEGIWEYKNENKTFKIKIKREKSFFKEEGIYWDGLNGTYCYTNSYDCQLNGKKKTLGDAGNDLDSLDEGFAVFMFSDIAYNKLGQARFEILKNGTAKWTLSEGGIRIKGIGRKGFSVPTDVILTKVKNIKAVLK